MTRVFRQRRRFVSMFPAICPFDGKCRYAAKAVNLAVQYFFKSVARKHREFQR